MRIVSRNVVTALGALGVAFPVTAQEHHHDIAHDEQLGTVHFPVACSAEGAERVQRGVTLLHSFWYEKAAEAFDEAASVDPGCAMAYWGRAMSILHPLWTPPVGKDFEAGRTASQQGLSVVESARERGYLQTIASYFDAGSPDHRSRLVAYSDAYARLHERHLDDSEATIFYALSLIAVGDATPWDTAFTYHKQAHQILLPLFGDQPNHPGLAHYLIHTNDSPKRAHLALEAARRYAEIAPDVPHALHMPSHIFIRLGLWDDAIESNIRSAASARKFEQENKLNAMWDQTAHAFDYVVYARLQQGKDRAAKQVVDEMAAVTDVFPATSLINDYALAAIPARYALERNNWRDAAALTVRPAPAWRATEAITHFARAIGAVRSGDLESARGDVGALSEIEKALEAAGGPQTFWSKHVAIQRIAAAAWVAVASGDTSEAVRLATEAAERDAVTPKHPVTPGAVLPARELLGDLLLAIGRGHEASAAYVQMLEHTPNRARSVYGAGRAAELIGDMAEAKRWYKNYLDLMAEGDGARPELRHARRQVEIADG